MNDDLMTWPWDEWNDIGGEGYYVAGSRKLVRGESQGT
jgi:hypothetical protein